MKAPLRLREHVASKAEQPLFSDQEVSEFRAIFQEFLEASSGKKVDWSVKPHQPYALHALSQLSEVLDDPEYLFVPNLVGGRPFRVLSRHSSQSCVHSSGKRVCAVGQISWLFIAPTGKVLVTTRRFWHL